MLLAALLVAAMLPASVNAESEATRVRKEILSVYRKTLYRNGMTSTNGWCGLQTSWALYLLGINTQLESHDGRDQFDSYKNRTVTSGGYRINPYSVEDYSLEEALNLLSRDGTRNVYNILVGFQRTSTASGRKYGHATFIHAILDGKVYFTEGFAVALGGRYCAGGAPMVGTIAEFCESYGAWTTYEGLIYFSGKEYEESCDCYGTNLYIRCTQDTQLLSDPGTIDGQEPYGYRQIVEGQRLYAVGLYQNKEDGGLYYEIVDEDGFSYINAEKTEMLVTDFSDVALSGVEAPTNHVMNTSFNVKGSLSSVNSIIDGLLIQVCRPDGTPVLEAQAQVRTKSFQIGQKLVREQMNFNSLAAGPYSIRISATVTGYYAADGKLEQLRQTLSLWNSEFQVGLRKDIENTPVVQYDACGGTTALDQQVGTALGQLPEATREGYTFEGWYTQPEGGTLAAEGTALTEDITLYAHWTKAKESRTGWVFQNDSWYYFENGEIKTGWMKDGDVIYYIQQDGSIATGWTEVNGTQRLFSSSGMLLTGWTETEEGRQFLLSNGAAAQGWVRVEDQLCYFDHYGIALTGWQEIDGNYYHMDAQGAPYVGYHHIGRWNCCFDDSGILLVAATTFADQLCCYVNPDVSEAHVMLSKLIKKCSESSGNRNVILPIQFF